MTEEILTRRRHALSGLLAGSAFLLEVLLLQVPALRGAAAWDRIGGSIERSNLVVFFELVFVLVPIGYHVALGAKVASRAHQIASVLFALFVLAHFWTFPVQRAFFGLGPEATYTRMVALFSRTWAEVPLLALAAVAGIGLACLHVALGLVELGRPRSLATVLGGILFAVGAASVVSLATGSAFVAAPSLPDTPCGAAVEMPAH